MGEVMAAEQERTITAAVLVIGDEILSGRTKDKNIGYIADYMTELGVDLKEVRVVPDEEDEIIAAVNALRKKYTYIFTTGGIGPTHDDITAGCVAKAFGKLLLLNQTAVEMLKTRILEHELNESRLRMAMIPEGAELIPNSVSAAPGFRVENVFVMAGVPTIMQAMIRVIGPTLETGSHMHSVSIDAEGLKEGDYAIPLGEVASHYPSLSIGSYPSLTDTGFRNQIVIRGKNIEQVRQAEQAVVSLLAEMPKRR